MEDWSDVAQARHRRKVVTMFLSLTVSIAILLAMLVPKNGPTSTPISPPPVTVSATPTTGEMNSVAAVAANSLGLPRKQAVARVEVAVNQLATDYPNCQFRGLEGFSAQVPRNRVVRHAANMARVADVTWGSARTKEVVVVAYWSC